MFTSMRDGELDIYSMRPDGSDVLRLTDSMGYDGGPFYSPDGSKIVYRSSRPTTREEIEDYTSLLVDGLIRPSELEIFVMDADVPMTIAVAIDGASLLLLWIVGRARRFPLTPLLVRGVALR